MEIRDLDLADLDAAEDVRRRSFGSMPEGRRDAWDALQTRAAAAGRLLAGYVDRRVVGMARIMPFRAASGWRWEGRRRTTTFCTPPSRRSRT